MNAKKLFCLLLAACLLLTLLPAQTLLAAEDQTYAITAPHVVTPDQTRAAAGQTVTLKADKIIDAVEVLQGEQQVPVTKAEGGFTFVMPAGDVTVKTYYAKTAIAELQDVRQQGNPFLPIYDFNPDGEPHVWEDPDNPGHYRLYFLSSHDMDKNHYCSNNHVLYSCPVEDPFNWTYHGVIIGPDNTEHNDILYAPDMGCVEDPSSPTGKYYYYWPCNQSGGRQTMVLRSSRPDGKGDPFTVVNWQDASHNRTTGSIMTFDPSVFVDDDGKVYGYWGGYQSNCSCAQLDPATNFTTYIAGTYKEDMLGDGNTNVNNGGQIFGFFEASSMRKIDGMYVFVYSRRGTNAEPEGRNFNQLGYAYSTSPTGPFTFGGTVVDAQGEVLNASSHTRTFAGGNTHGGLFKLGDQWYISYHRNVETYARQAMVAPVDITVDQEAKTVKITKAEVTSEGFHINGLNPYAKVSIGTACYMTGNGKIQPLYEHDVESLPVINLRANSVVGLKYFDFNTEAPKGSSSSLNVTLIPRGVNATMHVWLRPASDVNVTPFTDNCIELGQIKLTADMPQERTTINLETPQVDKVDGKWGVFYSFSNVSGNSDIADLYDMQFEFSDHEHKYEDVVTPATCLAGGFTTGVCSICGKKLVHDYTEALGHDWDEGKVTLEPTETSTGVMTYTCKRCGETKTKKISRIGATVPDDIDFTDPESAEQFEIRNSTGTAIEDGNGLSLICTRPAFEDCKEQNTGAQATTPEDVVVVPVEDDWIATLSVQFDTNGAGNGYYQFFGFYAMQGEEYQNLAGIRGGDKAMQNFIRQNGTITHQDEDGVNSAPGFDTSGKTYYLRLEKIGDTYTCFRSDDGETFTEMFAYDNTGIEADHLVIDAYTGMTTGYKFTLKSLTFESPDGPSEPELDKTALEKAIQDAEAVKKDDYTEETVKALDEALAAAKKALTDAKTQAELDAAAKALNDAIKALEKKPVLDKTALEKAIQDAEAVKKDEYTEESVKALDEALAAAKKALADAKTQKELDDAAKALNDAIKALEKKPVLDKAPLEKAIEEAEKLDADKYTEETAKALAEAIEAAKKALEEAKTQAELDAAKRALDDAIKALVEKPDVPTPTPTPHVCPGANFTDMPAVDYWSHAPIDWAIVNKITVGTSDTTFGPTEGCTRAQVVTFLWRAAKEPAPTSKENPFKDVKESDYFYNAVLWAVEKGITVGTDPDKFSPGETCTRAQIVTFLYRYEGKPEVKPDDSFTDVKADDYFADSVAWAVKNGITQGTDPGKFSPSDTCTREQVVTFLYRDIAE